MSDDERTEIISNLKARADFLAADISRTNDLGTELGFPEVNKIKDDCLQSLSRILTDFNEAATALPDYLINSISSELHASFDLLDGLKSKIGKIKISANGPIQEVIRNRTSIHSEANNIRNSIASKLIQQQATVFAAIGYKFAKEASYGDVFRRYSDEFEKIKNEQLNRLHSLEQTEKETTQLLQLLQTESTKKALRESQGGYEELASEHKKRHAAWFVGLSLSLFTLVLAVMYALFWEHKAQTNAEAFVIISQNALLISVAFVLSKVCLTKYNTERHLRITYDHRTAAIENLRIMVESIGAFPEAQAQLRIEAAKMLLSDPASGYMSNKEGAEVNINPMIGMLEKISASK